MRVCVAFVSTDLIAALTLFIILSIGDWGNKCDGSCGFGLFACLLSGRSFEIEDFFSLSFFFVLSWDMHTWVILVACAECRSARQQRVFVCSFLCSKGFAVGFVEFAFSMEQLDRNLHCPVRDFGVISDTLPFGWGGFVCEVVGLLLMPAESWVLHYT
jgi:hypothetical protein